MANVEQQRQAEIRRLAVLRVLAYAKIPVTSEYVSWVMSSTRYATGNARKKVAYEYDEHLTAKDLNHLHRAGLITKQVFRDRDLDEEAVKPQRVIWTLTAAGARKAK